MYDQNISLTTSDITKIYCDNSSDIDFAVSYTSKGTPYGYSVVSFCNGEAVIKESRVAKNISGLKDTILATISKKTLEDPDIKISDSLIEMNALEYAVIISNTSTQTNVIYDNYGNKYDTNTINDEDDASALACEIYDTPNENEQQVTLYTSNANDNKYEIKNNMILDKYKKHPHLFSEKYIEQSTNKYCCVISALTQIAYFEGMCKNTPESINTTYNNLWNASNIRTISESNNITYGGGKFNEAIDSFVQFAKENGHNLTTAQKQAKPSFEWIQRKLLDNNSVYFRYSIVVDENRAGHAISILGCSQTKKSSSGNEYDYLTIYDSWRNTPAYINYSILDFESCHAASFDIR